jgi:putative flavoprotein involved in K+ transport
LHTVEYQRPQDFAGHRVIVVGGGDSGAQIAADLADHTELTRVTQRPPHYLADDINGHAHFDAATARPPHPRCTRRVRPGVAKQNRVAADKSRPVKPRARGARHPVRDFETSPRAGR